MLTTPHFLTGAAVASKVPQFWPAALMALTLHFVLDAIPHRDTIGGDKLNLPNIILVLADGGLALILFFLIVNPELLLYSFLIGIFAVLPDLLELPGFFWPKWRELPGIKQFHHWHGQVLQKDRPKVNWFWGLLPQVIVVALILLYIL
jgi:hypothetical protein